jgi:DNA invertase Pin-like site-specific DNA recombinase
VLVFALDRLGRSLRDLLLILDDLAAAGCSVISLRESIDLSTPTPAACRSTSSPAWPSSSGS